MYMPDTDSEPMGTAEKASVLVFLVLILGLFTADIAVNYQPVKLSVLFVVLFWIPLLVLHEFAHEFMAWVVGWHVYRVVIGFGSLFWSFSMNGAKVEIRQIPITGYIQRIALNMKFPRAKDFLVYFAGPGSALLVSLAVVLFVGPNRIFQASETYAMIGCQSLALAGAVQAFTNLVPFLIMTPTQTMPNDGMGMLLSFFRPVEYYAQMVSHFESRKSDWFDSSSDDR